MTPLDRLLARVDPLFKSPALDEKALPAGLKLHKTHRELLVRRNGGYFWGGALHLFGACAAPETHSLAAWNAPALWRAEFGTIADNLTFFAENAFGDQFGLAPDGGIVEFHAETAEASEVADDFDQWLLIAVEATDELLARPRVAAWISRNGRLPHGSQLQAYPPFVFAEADDAVEVTAVEAVENMRFHAAITRQIAELPEGAQARIVFTDEGLEILPAEPA